MAAVAQINGSFLPGCVGFRIHIWDLNMDATTERPTLRLVGGSLKTTGYSSESWKHVNGSSYSQATKPAVVTDWSDPTGCSSLGLVYGYWDGFLLDSSSNTWGVYGRFRDDYTNDRTQVEVFDRFTLANVSGFRVASGNASNWSAGTTSWQSWV